MLLTPGTIGHSKIQRSGNLFFHRASSPFPDTAGAPSSGTVCRHLQAPERPPVVRRRPRDAPGGQALLTSVPVPRVATLRTKSCLEHVQIHRFSPQTLDNSVHNSSTAL